MPKIPLTQQSIIENAIRIQKKKRGLTFEINQLEKEMIRSKVRGSSIEQAQIQLSQHYSELHSLQEQFTTIV